MIIEIEDITNELEFMSSEEVVDIISMSIHSFERHAEVIELLIEKCEESLEFITKYEIKKRNKFK